MQQPHLIDEAAVIVLELHLQHLALVLALHLVEHGAQRQHLALLQRLACQLVVAFVGVGLGQIQSGAQPQRTTQRKGAQQRGPAKAGQ